MHFAKAGFTLSAFVSVAVATYGYTATNWCNSDGLCFQRFYDQDFGVSFAVAAPEIDSDEFVVQITAPNNFGWTGLVLGDSFDDNMMLAAWPNGNASVSSCRITSGFSAPAPYEGPKLTMLPGSTVDDWTTTAVFRCEGCTSWTGGSLDMEQTINLYYAMSVVQQVPQPNNPQSSIPMFGFSDFFSINLNAAKTSSYNSFIKRSLPPHA